MKSSAPNPALQRTRQQPRALSWGRYAYDFRIMNGPTATCERWHDLSLPSPKVATSSA